jgi:hypothetical protein
MNTAHKRKKSPVTIIIGMICEQAMCVVCDSRTTETTGLVHDDTQKLHAVRFRDGSEALIARAGNDPLSARVLEIISNTAQATDFQDYRAAAELAERAVEEIKVKMRKQFVGTSEELQKHFEAHSFELLIANYFNGKPYLFTLQFELGQAVLVLREYVSIGCGWILADFLLGSLNVRQYHISNAIWTAVYAVEEIKKFDPRCGGQVRAGILRCVDGKSDAFIVAEKRMNDIAAEVGAFSAKQAKDWVEKVDQALAAMTSREIMSGKV